MNVINGHSVTLGCTSLAPVVIELVLANGEKYVGEFQNGKFHGQGTFFYANGKTKYVGEFQNGKFHGQGTYFYANGSRYEGNYRDGLRNGQGTFFYNDGNRYEGLYHEGKQQGQGTFFFADNKSKYVGEFHNDKFHGQGTYFFEDGSRYEGDFKDDKRDGQGTLFYANGKVEYVGTFQNGLFNGQGIRFLPDGSKYVGSFLDGKFHGKGILYFVTGDRYEGDFQYGKCHGKGIVISNEGDRTQLEFQYDEAISNISHLGDTLFLQLLSQKFKSGGPKIYPLGIVSDYLIKNGYEETGRMLHEAWQTRLLCANPENRQAKAEEIYNRLQILNQPVLLFLGSTSHAMGLQMKQTVEGFVDFEIYNSGSGLEFHKQHPKKKQKFQTVWKRRVPIANLTPDQLQQFLETFTKTCDAYDVISKLPGSQEIAQDEGSVIWQKEQQGNNCTLMWIFSYMKNNMTSQEYTDACTELYAKGLWIAKQAEEPDQVLINALAQKLDKLLTKKIVLSGR